MSLYEITRSCGHTEETQIRGTNTRGERERRATYEATLPCSDCRQRQAAEQRAQVADEWVDLAALPALVGSERQVAWAANIRIRGIATIVGDATHPPDGFHKLVRAVQTGHPAVAFGPALEQLDPADRAVVAHLLLDAALRHHDARWWIDHRDHITGAAVDAMTEDEYTQIARLLGHP